MAKRNTRNIYRTFSRLDGASQKKLFWSFTIIFLLIMIFCLYFEKQQNNYSNIKEYKNNYLVFTKTENVTSKTYSIHVPYINIKADTGKAINDDIDSFVNSFSHCKNLVVSYEYDINGIILSVVIKVVDYDTDYAPDVFFKSYNINLDTLDIISDDSLLDFFGIDSSGVEAKMENQFRIYYDELVSEGYYHKDECNYSCFLKYRGVENYLDSLSYYVKNGDLIAFKPFVFASIYGEEAFFKESHFEFLLVESGKE